MPAYVDIHAHLLPGIDDGPSHLNDALAMARAANESGIATMAATPHLRRDFPNVHVDELAGRCEALRQAIAEDGIALRIVSGAEASLPWALEASDKELKLASFGGRGHDLLVETPMSSVAGLDRLLYEVLIKGLRITLAHPERGPDFQRHPEMLEDLARQGVLLQVNADSLLDGASRSPVRRLAHELCRRGIAHVLGSDGHRADSWRPVTRLAQAAEVAQALAGPERAHWMVSTVPAAIIDGEELPAAPEVAPQRRRRWLFGG